MGKGEDALLALQQAIIQDWDNIELEILEELINSMETRINAVIAAKCTRFYNGLAAKLRWDTLWR